MDWMTIIADVLKIVLPAAAVILTALYLMRGFYENEQKRRLYENRMNNQKSTLPVRLQAYERIILLLERISPNNLLIRVPKGNLNAKEYQTILLSEIRNEYDHNLSQQLYISQQAWQEVKNAKEELTSMINNVTGRLPEDAKAIDLSRAIFEQVIQQQHSPTDRALRVIKLEAQSLF